MMLKKKALAWLFGVGILTSVLSSTAWAEPSVETQKIIAAHRQAAIDAQKQASFHGEMEKAFITGRGGSKVDMVGHCRYWADYYRKQAAQEEQAAKDLERKNP